MENDLCLSIDNRLGIQMQMHKFPPRTRVAVTDPSKGRCLGMSQILRKLIHESIRGQSEYLVEKH